VTNTPHFNQHNIKIKNNIIDIYFSSVEENQLYTSKIMRKLSDSLSKSISVEHRTEILVKNYITT
jgi:hypothetical protein